MPIEFAARSAYRSPKSAFNSCGSEGTRSPGNIPRTFGFLYSDTHAAPSPEFRANGTQSHPMTGQYGCPKQHNFGAIDNNPQSKNMPPLLGRNLAFAWAGRTAHPDLTPTTIKLNKNGAPVYLETGVGALRYDNEGTGFAICQTYKDDDNDGAADMNNHQGGGFDRFANDSKVMR